MRRMRREKVCGRGGQSRGEESVRVPEPCMPLGKTCVQPHLFGPVPSRRLGRSLGVDLVPLKTCTFDSAIRGYRNDSQLPYAYVPLQARERGSD